jgi:hypothetical protein
MIRTIVVPAGRLVFRTEAGNETSSVISVTGWNQACYVVTVRTKEGFAREKLVVTGR